MVLISMQVACGCGMDAETQTGHPSPCDPEANWYNEEELSGGLTAGQRYLWRCQSCGNVMCVNLRILDGDEE